MQNGNRIGLGVAMMLAAGCGDETLEANSVLEESFDVVPGEGTGAALAIGDSILEWNADTQDSIPEVYGRTVSRPVTNGAIGGTRMLQGERRIPSQYTSAGWARVLIDGGGNDVGSDGCGCGDCMSVVDEVISADGDSGAMVELVERITQDSAEVVLLGYYAPPPFGEFAECDEELAALNSRYSALASSRADVRFIDMGDVVDYTANPEYFSDEIHPSVLGSQVIGQYIAEILGN